MKGHVRMWWQATQNVRALGVKQGDLLRFDVNAKRPRPVTVQVVWPERRSLPAQAFLARHRLFAPVLPREVSAVMGREVGG